MQRDGAHAMEVVHRWAGVWSSGRLSDAERVQACVVPLTDRVGVDLSGPERRVGEATRALALDGVAGWNDSEYQFARPSRRIRGGVSYPNHA